MATARADNYWEGYLRKLIEKKQLHPDSAHIYGPVYRAILGKDWEVIREFIQNHPEAATARVTDANETILHKVVESLDAISVAEEIVEIMPSEMLEELTDENGDTALSRAALVGNSKAVRLMVQKNSKLVNIENKDGHTPLDHAARYGHAESLRFLLSITLKSEGSRFFTGDKGSRLLMYLINSNLFGVALDLLKHYPEILHHGNKDRKTAFIKLARKPQAFASGDRLGYWQSFIYHCIPLRQTHNPLLFNSKTSQRPVLRHGQDIENPEESSTNYLQKPFGNKGFLPIVIMPVCRSLNIIWRALKDLVPSIRYLHDKKLMHVQVLELTRTMIHGVNWSDNEANDTLRSLIVVAARLGNHEIVDEVIKAYPASVIYLDDDGRNVFQRAVMFRNEKVVNLLHQLPMVKQWVESFREYIPPYFKTNNNILHLAARFGPSSRVPGAALQMQRELQWYKAVESLFHPSLQQEENNKYQTPRERFTEEHKALVKAGEEWMKGTASSCTVVAALIITVVFAAAFTAPGGNNNDGVPNFSHKIAFLVFAIFDALALFSSTTSVLMFLGILTSRYSEDDFLMSLPQKLIIGLVTLFFSIATMMIAFGAALHLLLVQSIRWIVIPVGLLACVPISLFAGLQFLLLVEMIHSTYGPGLLQSQKDY